jgi:hypothetical protein
MGEFYGAKVKFYLDKAVVKKKKKKNSCIEIFSDLLQQYVWNQWSQFGSSAQWHPDYHPCCF